MNVESQTPASDSVKHDRQEANDDSVDESRPAVPARRGDVGKCPVCGSPVDPDAYHCPKCRNYFCFHCRARLLPADTQVQCLNQHCDYYGKLICGVCNSQHDKEDLPSVYAEPQDGYWPLWLVISLFVGGVVWCYSVWWIGVLATVLLYVGGGYGLQRAKFNIFGTERKVTQARSSSYRTCIHCQEPVNEIRTGR